jgi:phosphoribosylaminoimidazolecarboxamide formyltransferase/IMP cyclohydrolase
MEFCAPSSTNRRFSPGRDGIQRASCTKSNRQPTEQELADMLFGWKVEAGVTSNSVLYVKDGVTVGIGTGEQDRVGVAEIARDKAYRKLADKLCWEKYQTPIQPDGGWGPKIRHRSRSRQLSVEVFLVL